jgi:hypothetical protein
MNNPIGDVGMPINKRTGYSGAGQKRPRRGIQPGNGSRFNKIQHFNTREKMLGFALPFQFE